jgi:hypothetical protein
MSLDGKFPAKPHSRRQSGCAKTDPIKDLLYIMIALNLDVGKGAVGIVAADSKSFWQSVNTIKANGHAQRTCDPDEQGFNLRVAQQFANWLRHVAPPPFWADVYAKYSWSPRPSVAGFVGLAARLSCYWGAKKVVMSESRITFYTRSAPGG